MEERGIVIESGHGKALVRIERARDCAEGCQGCLYHDLGKYMEADVFDCVGVSPGDRVLIETKATNSAKASLQLFGVPLLALFAGYGAGAALSPVHGASGAGEGIGIASGAVFFVASFAVMFVVSGGKTAAKNLRSEIVRVLEGDGRT